MRTFVTIVCSVLKMERRRNAPVNFIISVCLVPVYLINYMELYVIASALCMYVCCLIMLSIAKVNNT
jgi:hypothetical protein